MNENELLLTTIKKCRRIDLYVDPQPLTPSERLELALMQSRKDAGEPLQYITGQCEFMNIVLTVNSSVLIPRPETELLVEFMLHQIRLAGWESSSILDIGTGSGNIALSLAKELPKAMITALDISQEALAVAQKNAQINGLAQRVQWIKSDLFSFSDAPSESKKFDCIVSNPPYIPTGELGKLPANVQREPKIALDGGEDGLDFYRRIIRKSPEFLKDKGFLFLEMGDGQSEDIVALFNENSCWVIKDILKDYANTERAIMAQVR
ncbi:MAG: peptide chain release factor N(5)-glutamine methyltransferase [Candidatus Omnitrophota bacterium]